jgi:hypothetical protein
MYCHQLSSQAPPPPQSLNHTVHGKCIRIKNLNQPAACTKQTGRMSGYVYLTELQKHEL